MTDPMTDPMDIEWVEQAHADAILSMLAVAPPAQLDPLVVHDGKVPPLSDADRLRGYVVAHITTTTPSGTRLTGIHDRTVTRAYLHCVGVDAATARAIAGRACAALRNKKPTISGRECFPIREDPTDLPPRPDETTGIAVFDLVKVMRLESVASA